MTENRRLHVYYLPGRYEPLSSGPGGIVLEAGMRLSGRTLPGDLGGLAFDEQTAVVRSDLTAFFLRPEALAIGRSYGAYLLLHALAGLAAFPGHVLLFSPVLGAAVARRDMGLYGVIPPRAGELEQLAGRGAFPAPASLDIYLGDADPGCSVEFADELATMIGGRLHVVSGVGHDLPLTEMREALRAAMKTD